MEHCLRYRNIYKWLKIKDDVKKPGRNKLK